MHVYIDETKHGDYIMVAAFVPAHHVAEARRVVRNLLLPQQRRLHMKNEKESRRKEIMDALCELSFRAVVYDAGRRHRNNRERRAACLRAIVSDSAKPTTATLIIERDESLVSFDRQKLIEFIRQERCGPTLHYTHRQAHDDLLLGLPDAIAWCWAKGGQWRQRVEPIIGQVRHV